MIYLRVWVEEKAAPEALVEVERTECSKEGSTASHFRSQHSREWRCVDVTVTWSEFELLLREELHELGHSTSLCSGFLISKRGPYV